MLTVKIAEDVYELTECTKGLENTRKHLVSTGADGSLWNGVCRAQGRKHALYATFHRVNGRFCCKVAITQAGKTKCYHGTSCWAEVLVA